MSSTGLDDGKSKLQDNLLKIDSRIEDLIRDQESIQSMKEKYIMTAEADREGSNERQLVNPLSLEQSAEEVPVSARKDFKLQ